MTSTVEMSDDCVSKFASLVLLGTNFSPSEPPGEIMSFGMSPVNYSDSDSEQEDLGLIHASAMYCPWARYL